MNPVDLKRYLTKQPHPADCRFSKIVTIVRPLIIGTLLGLSFYAGTKAHADMGELITTNIYVVGSIGIGGSYYPHPDTLGRSYGPSTVQERSTTGSLGLGLRYKYVAVEAGAISLPKYHSYVEAYNPNRSATQDITARAVFARALVYGPHLWAIQPYGFLGVARVHGENHEQGQCATCGAGYVPDWHNQTSATVPYYGVGLSVPFAERLEARAEFGLMPHAVDSFWTGRRDYRLATVGVLYKF